MNAARAIIKLPNERLMITRNMLEKFSVKISRCIRYAGVVAPLKLKINTNDNV